MSYDSGTIFLYIIILFFINQFLNYNIIKYIIIIGFIYYISPSSFSNIFDKVITTFYYYFNKLIVSSYVYSNIKYTPIMSEQQQKEYEVSMNRLIKPVNDSINLNNFNRKINDRLTGNRNMNNGVNSNRNINNIYS